MLTLATFGQGDSTSIYCQALRYYNEHLDRTESTDDEIFIETNNGITDKFPLQVGKRKVTILTWENQKEVYIRHKNRIRHIKVFPARTYGDVVEINFTPYFGEYRGKKNGNHQYNHAVSDWVIIQFKFDCTKKRFIYSDTKIGGI